MSEPLAAEAETAAETAAPNRPWVFAAALSAMFMAAIEGTIVATAMPGIVGTLGDFELFSWVFTSYLLAQAATIPVYGKLADLYGRKHVLFFGIGVFLFGSLLCGFAWSMASLIAFRALQGLGAGAVMPVAQTVVGDLYRGEERARMQGFISAIFGSAAILGPIAGAVLVQHLGWPAVFWINIPLGLIAAVMLAVLLRETVQRRNVRIDWLGSFLMTVSTGALMLALVDAASLGGTAIAALIAFALAAFVLLLLNEQQAAEPVLPLRLWRNRLVAIGNANSFICGAAVMAIIAFLPAYVQGVLGRSAFVAGLTLMAMSAFWSIGGFVAGRMLLRWTYRTTALAGTVVVIAGSVMMSLLDPGRGAAWAVAAALVIGFGMGLTNNCMVVAIQANTTWAERGVATSSIVYTRIVGNAIGTAAFGGILNAALSAYITGGGDLVNRMMDPALRAALPAASIAPLLHEFAAALHTIFLINLGLALLVVAIVAALPRSLGLKRA
ncbi:MAG TPA: MDR family MFS transporter [Alphaproteobacteria bacterium]